MLGLGILLTLAALAIAPAVSAQEQWSMRFDVRYGPLRAARVLVDARQDARSYSIRGQAQSTGIVGLIRDFHFDLAADGARVGDAYRPAFFIGDIDTGWHETRVEMQYPGGVPRVLTLAPEEPVEHWTLDPTRQAGTLDPLSALLTLIRPRPRDELCGVTVETFDGRRRGRVSLAEPVEDRGALVCAGLYRRLAGFSPEDMADYDRMPFTVVFEQSDAGSWHLTRAVTQTPYGRMRLVPSD